MKVVVQVDRLRLLQQGAAGHPLSFIDVQAALWLDFFPARRAVLALRDTGLLERLGLEQDKPTFRITPLAERLLALAQPASAYKTQPSGTAAAVARLAGVVAVVQAVPLQVASVAIEPAQAAVVELGITLPPGRPRWMRERIEKLVAALEDPATRPVPLRLALVMSQ